MDHIAKKMRDHYTNTFQVNGANSKGVDWGVDQAKLELRYEKMLALCSGTVPAANTILDVGCGFGGLFEYAATKGYQFDYTGVDIVESMIFYARERNNSAEFIHGNILDLEIAEKFDFVVCNGILTQKLDVPGREMDEFCQLLIKRMYELCRVGIAFNVMSTKVNFFSNNLYYRNPSELVSWCMSEITPYVKLDHAYPLYEYTIYLYREPR